MKSRTLIFLLTLSTLAVAACNSSSGGGGSNPGDNDKGPLIELKGVEIRRNGVEIERGETGRIGDSLIVSIGVAGDISGDAGIDIVIKDPSEDILATLGATSNQTDYTYDLPKGLEGDISVSIAKKDDFSDSDGNAGRVGSNSFSFVVDTKLPVAQQVTITVVGEDATNDRAISGDAILVTFMVSERLKPDSTPDVRINNSRAEVDLSTDGITWQARYTVPANAQAAENTPVAIGLIDVVGNGEGDEPVPITTITGKVSILSELPDLSVAISHTGGNEIGDATYLNAGDTVTLAFSEVVPPGRTAKGFAITAATVAGRTATHNSNEVTLTIPAGLNADTLAYSVNYTVGSGRTVKSDTNGNYVIDTTTPQLSSLVVSAGAARVSAGDIVVDFSADETLSAAMVTLVDNGGSEQLMKSASFTNGSWRATFPVNELTEGSYSGAHVRVDATDDAGNGASGLTLPAATGTVTVDKTAPSLGTVAITSSNTNSSLAKVGDRITLTFIAEEAIQQPLVTIAGATIDSQNITDVSNDGFKWQAEYAVPSDFSADGTVQFTITYSDIAGNSGSAVSSTTDGSSVSIDTTAPQLTELDVSPDTARLNSGDIVVSFTADETLSSAPTVVTLVGSNSGFTNMRIARLVDGKWRATFSVGDLTDDSYSGANVRVDTTDVVGNRADISLQSATGTVTVDTKAPTAQNPTIQIENDGDNIGSGNSGETILVTFTTSEQLQANSKPEVRIHGSNTRVDLSTDGATWQARYTIPASVGGTTAVSVDIRLIDSAGNDSGFVGITSFDDIAIISNLSGLVATISNNGGNTVNNSVYLNEADTVTLIFSEDVPAGQEQGFVITAATVAGQTATTVAGQTATINNHEVTLTIPAGLNAPQLDYTVDYTVGTGTAANSGSKEGLFNDYVIDTTTPQLASLRVDENGEEVNSGTIVVRFTTNEDVVATSATLAGNEATITGSNRDWTATFAVADFDDGDYRGADVRVDATDDAGNGATDLSFATTDVVKVDTTAAQLVSLRLTADAARVNSGNVVVDFTSDDVLREVSVTLGNLTVMATGSGVSWSAAFAVGLLSDGDYSGSDVLVDATDDAGNGAALALATATGAVTVDKVSPSLDTVAITSSNANTRFAKAGDRITVSFTADEAIQQPSVTISGETIDSRNITDVSNDGFKWQAVYDVPADLSNDDRNVQFTITYSDIVGNSGVDISATTDGSSVFIDTTAPQLRTLSLTPSGTTPINSGEIIVQVASTENLSAASVTLGSVEKPAEVADMLLWEAKFAVAELNDGIYRATDILVDLADEAGNSATGLTDATAVGAVTIDKTAPTVIVRSIQVERNGLSISGTVRLYDEIVITVDGSDDISHDGEIILKDSFTYQTGGERTYTDDNPKFIFDTFRGVGKKASWTIRAGFLGSSSLSIRDDQDPFYDYAGNRGSVIVPQGVELQNRLVDTIELEFASGTFSLGDTANGPANRGETIYYTMTMNKELAADSAAPTVSIREGLTVSTGQQQVFQETSRQVVNGVTQLTYAYTIPRNATASDGHLIVDITGGDGVRDIVGNAMTRNAEDNTNADFTTDAIRLYQESASSVTVDDLRFTENSDFTANVGVTADTTNVYHLLIQPMGGGSVWRDTGFDVDRDSTVVMTFPSTPHLVVLCASFSEDTCTDADPTVDVGTTVSPLMFDDFKPLVWYEARDIYGDGSPVADNTLVDVLKDKSGNNYHAQFVTDGIDRSKMKVVTEDGKKMLTLNDDSKSTAYSVSPSANIFLRTLEVYTLIKPHSVELNSEGVGSRTFVVFDITSRFSDKPAALRYRLAVPGATNQDVNIQGHLMDAPYDSERLAKALGISWFRKAEEIEADRLAYGVPSVSLANELSGYTFKSSYPPIYLANGDRSTDTTDFGYLEVTTPKRLISLTEAGDEMMIHVNGNRPKDFLNWNYQGYWDRLLLFNKLNKDNTVENNRDLWRFRGHFASLFAFNKPLQNYQSTAMKKYIQSEYGVDMGIVTLSAGSPVQTCADNSPTGVVLFNATDSAATVSGWYTDSGSRVDLNVDVRDSDSALVTPASGGCPSERGTVVTYTATANGFSDTIMVVFE